jgi:hypothetical protein
MIDNTIVQWMCFIAGWLLVVFAGIGGIWIIIKCVYDDIITMQKYCNWKKRAMTAEFRLRDVKVERTLRKKEEG